MKKLQTNKIAALIIIVIPLIIFFACKKSNSNTVYSSFWQASQLSKYVKFEAAFIEDTSGKILARKLVTITSVNYGTTKGYTDSTGKVIGLIPASETLVMNVFNDCNSIIYTQDIGPFSTDKNLGTVYASHAAAPISVTVKGVAVTCGNTSVVKGSVMLSIENDHYSSTIVNGNFTFTFTRCNDLLPPVTLTAYDSVNNEAGVPQTVKINAGSQNIVQVKACPAPPVAGFTFNAGNGYAPDTVIFSNTTTNNATSYVWNFGDGATSTLQNPVHIYTTAGDYTVTLTATGIGGANSYSNIIHISLVTPVAAFIFNAGAGSVPDTVTFSNSSIYANGYIWDFGDGTSSTVPNPVHIYTNAGNYTVTLTATRPGGTSSTSKTIYITSGPTDTYINLTLGASHYSWTSANGLSNSRIDSGTFYNTLIQGGNTTGTPEIYTSLLILHDNASSGSYSFMLSGHVYNVVYSSGTVITNVTEYGPVGGYITGTSSGTAHSPSYRTRANPSGFVSFSCSYRVIRTQ